MAALATDPALTTDPVSWAEEKAAAEINQVIRSGGNDASSDGAGMENGGREGETPAMSPSQPAGCDSTVQQSLCKEGEDPLHKMSMSVGGDARSPSSQGVTIDQEINRCIFLWKGDAVALPKSLPVDALVNPTNERLDSSEGLSGMILRRGGAELFEEIAQNFPEGCRTGAAVATRACSLPCRKIIHTVGPRWNEKYKIAAENALHSCYRSCLQILLEEDLSSIAIPCIYTPRKGFPRHEAIHTALRTVRRFLERFRSRIARLIFVVETFEDLKMYQSIMPLYFPRDAEELQTSKSRLPKDMGNEWGELQIKERKIRIGSLPGAELFLGERQDSGSREGQGRQVEAPAAFRKHIRLDTGFMQMMNDMDEERLQRLREEQKKMDGSGADDDADVVAGENDLYQSYLQEANDTDLRDIRSLQAFYKPGVDREHRPVFVIVLKHLPRDIDLHRALLHIISRMDTTVEQDYVMVLVMTCSTSENRPPLSWIRKMYAIFEHKYRKNMRKL